MAIFSGPNLTRGYCHWTMGRVTDAVVLIMVLLLIGDYETPSCIDRWAPVLNRDVIWCNLPHFLYYHFCSLWQLNFCITCGQPVFSIWCLSRIHIFLVYSCCYCLRNEPKAIVDSASFSSPNNHSVISVKFISHGWHIYTFAFMLYIVGYMPSGWVHFYRQKVGKSRTIHCTVGSIIFIFLTFCLDRKIDLYVSMQQVFIKKTLRKFSLIFFPSKQTRILISILDA